MKILICLAFVIWSSVDGIYDGHDAAKHQFPHVVYIQNPQSYCAGALISDRHVLTAAHCLMNIEKGDFVKIVLKMHQTDGYGATDGIKLHSSKFWMHERFSMPSVMNDIGIIELPQSIIELVNNTKKAKAIEISTESTDDDEEVILAGWGHIAESTPAKSLKFAKMKLINMTECMKYKSHYIESLTSNHICAVGVKGMPCSGDSGAAVISTKSNKIIGIASFGKDAENGVDIGRNDCDAEVPAVFTKISSYIDWISAKTSIDFNKVEKVCEFKGVIKAENINQLSDCEIIDGNIEITDETFLQLKVESLQILEAVKKITGYLSVRASQKSFTNLSFLKNLAIIEGHQSIISLLIYETSLTSLNLTSLKQINNGAIVINSNKNLCFVETLDWQMVKAENHHAIIVRSNRDENACVNSTVGFLNGSQATKHQFPYVVYVRTRTFFCSGTLISDKHVLTAAHCLMKLRQGDEVQINLGMHQSYGYGKSDGIDVYSSKFWIHENFSMPLAMFDIGIVELTKSIDELVNDASKARPIGISTKVDAENDLNDDEVILAGWGFVEGYTHANTLLYTKMKLINMTECKKYQSHYIETITKDHICTEQIKGMPCDGDSGTGIVSTKTNKLIGIGSFIKDAENGVEMPYNDCKSKIPVVSTRVSSYIDWISAKTGIDFNKVEKNCKFEEVINSQNINELSDCEIIDGNVQINDDISYESLKVLLTVQRITGSLKVEFINSQNITDLSFLKNLKYIDNTKNESYALEIHNTTLTSLALKSLMKVNGGVYIRNNKNLCIVDEMEWSNLMHTIDYPVIIGNNNNAGECEADNQIFSQ